MTNDNDSIITALGATAIGVGILGALSPRAFRGVYGVGDDSDEATYVTRLFSTRNVALGALALTTTDDVRKTTATVFAAMNAADALIGLTTAGSGVAGRTKLFGVLTSSAFAVGSALVASRS